MAKQPSREEINEQTESAEKSEISLTEALDGQKLKPTISLFRMMIENGFGDKLHLNVMTGKPEYFERITRTWREWTDVSEAQLRARFQKTYGLYHEKMLSDALRIHFDSHQVNPLTRLLESLAWDGKPRIASFLRDVMQCDDTPYYREVSRLIFAGGIHRAYSPGCKFDDMVVLVGPQGGGKSTIVRWLNVEDQYFREIRTITGKEGIESLRGVWIAEVAELMAVTRVKETEAVKAFITAREDSYREPYSRYVQTIPRRCTFIGTTNNAQFLSDRTGNRRFYPVQCKAEGHDLLSREEEIREHIRQCWAEALYLYKQDRLSPYADPSILEEIRQKQEEAMEDDWRVGAITTYLDTAKMAPGSTVSVIELWHNALGEIEDSKPTRRDSNEIVQIMNGMEGWRRSSHVASTKWGRQKVYEREPLGRPF